MRTVYCGDLNISNVGLLVVLCGWVNRCRFFPNFVFIEIRDREGSVQVFFDSNRNYEVFVSAVQLKNEFCVQVAGIVRARPVNQINHDMKTGEIEILATNMKIINSSEPLPLDLSKDNSESLRLKYRYLDLRRSVMFQRLKNRSRIMSYIHRFMEMQGFLNIETPMLTNVTPEGARNYFVPSRLHKGKFYALPQSPQIFKQLLMISGFDRYYQIVKCFRDEDIRSNRQSEFTQIDLETSFMSADKVREIVESLICNLWKEILGVELKKFSCLTYREAINQFATDSPDLRNPIRLTYMSDIQLSQIKSDMFSTLDVKNITFKVIIMHIPKGSRRLSEIEIDQYVNDFKSFGGTNLTWIRFYGSDCNKIFVGSAIHFFDHALLNKILLESSCSENDFLFLSCEYGQFPYRALNMLRVKLGNDLKIINKNSWEPLWIIDFPMFKKNDQGDIVSMHHLFTAPKNIDVEVLLNDPLSSIADSFDLVINGCEVGSGSVRIHLKEVQEAVFKILGFDKSLRKDNEFGFFLDALQYGTPIHAGMACGLDRLVMLLNRTNNIRNVIAFPKTTHGFDLMTQTPSVIDESQIYGYFKNK